MLYSICLGLSEKFSSRPQVSDTAGQLLKFLVDKILVYKSNKKTTTNLR